MTFGQQTGPPASAKQVQELLALVEAAGHTGFRDARGPMGLTQRQSNGKFTRDEADSFIQSLGEQALDAPSAPPVCAPAPPPAPAGSLRRVPDEQLASELRRRGWTVVAP